MFHDILERKTSFKDCKNSKLKSGKTGIFPKAILHGFGQNLQISMFLFQSK